MANPLISGHAEPNVDGRQDVDVYDVALTTGTASLTFDEPFDEAPSIVTTSPTGDAGYSNLTASDVDLSGTGSETVTVIAIGPRGGV